MKLDRRSNYSKRGKNFNISKYQGNFIQGFTFTNIKYQYNDSASFSIGKLYIKPDLSRIIFGDIVMSTVIIEDAKVINITNKFYFNNNHLIFKPGLKKI